MVAYWKASGQKLTAERAREFLRYDPVTGFLHWIAPRPGRKSDPRYGAGERPHKGGGRVISIDGKNYTTARIIWLISYGVWPKGQVWHKNGDTADERLENLMEDKYRKGDQPKELTYDLLKSLVTYDPDTGEIVWNRRVGRSAGRAIAGKVIGKFDSHGYRRAMINRRMYRCHRLAWLYMTGNWSPPGMVVDHKNGDKLDNRWANLRLATRAQNAQNNDGRSSRKSSPYRGVYPLKNGKWEAKMMIRLGVFDTPEEAREAAIAGAKRFYGEFARG